MKNTTLWTALITPMKESGEVHFEDLEKLIRRQEEAGNGVLLIGSTGEGLALDDEEQKEIVRFAKELDLHVPIMAGVGGFQISKQKDWIKYCNDKVDAFLIVSPLYAKPGPEGQKIWFRELMDIAEKQCMIYNIPSRTGVEIPPNVMGELSGHPNFWSIKEASGNLADFQSFREMVPDIPMFSGDDGLMPFLSVAGASGLVSVASNVWPKETAKFVEYCLSGNTESLFLVWKHAVEMLFSAPNPIPAKVLLYEKGIIESPELRLPLTANDFQHYKRLKTSDTEIMNWYKKINK
ncbi:4-hydroxy-tetrahydrodipicolinate synthase [Rhodohalobacter barkolensis]|uniref:4-hydroxy-tetrahydrodipicolinate synthase n=1 Tax=Rhodohalobacter barkolensis TaxID=2053187 RepID=A0A2N0VM55_9BACT|nr:4-hydroxy-tetrahydrodipicolinate synthase [Rhodohalobacter barkolensis]PKD45262.1 4-hydroxy-tetrahydrodipicolinate synthase [Rhodohalobacter barkolensis]